MSKELEALKEVVSYQWWDCYNDEPQEMNEKQQQAYDHLVKYLTPPTDKDVVMALLKHFDKKIFFYDEISRTFKEVHLTRNDEYVSYFRDGTITINVNYGLPPHLITLIGRFYEGLEAKK